MLDVEKYLRKQVVLSFAANLFINAGLAWWLLRERDALTAWGERGYGPDLLLTGFLLSLAFSYMNLIIHRKKCERGQLPTSAGNLIVNWLPYKHWQASLLLVFAGVIPASLTLIGALEWFYQPHITPVSYALIKGFWTGALAAALVVICIHASMRRGLNEF